MNIMVNVLCEIGRQIMRRSDVGGVPFGKGRLDNMIGDGHLDFGTIRKAYTIRQSNRSVLDLCNASHNQ